MLQDLQNDGASITHTTTTGAVFTQVTIGAAPDFSQAWRDPSQSY